MVLEKEQCARHQQPVTYVCARPDCTEVRQICDKCRNSDTAHISHHANFIYSVKEFNSLVESQELVNQLQKNISSCSTSIASHVKLYQEEITTVNRELDTLHEQVMRIIADKRGEIVQLLQDRMRAFDSTITDIRNQLRQFKEEKSNQSSFFKRIFAPEDEGDGSAKLDNLIRKNAIGFKLRSEIIDLKSRLKEAQTNRICFKPSKAHEARFTKLRDYYVSAVSKFYSESRKLLTEANSTLENDSEISEDDMSSMSSSTKFMSHKSLKDSTASNFTQKSIQERQIPKLNPCVDRIRKTLPRFFGSQSNSSNPNIQGTETKIGYSKGVYIGKVTENHQKEGYGLFIYNDGSMYEGDWKGDKMTGIGRLIRPMFLYQGGTVNGKAHGSGIFQSKQLFYRGDWVADLRHGNGFEIKGPKHTYQGSFVKNKYEGKGILVKEDFTYEGFFKNGLFEGKGVMRYQSGDSFEGEHRDGKQVYGILRLADNTLYEGDVLDGKPEGLGVFRWADGTSYNGMWKNGLQDGQGVQTEANGRQYKGIWLAGKNQTWLT